MLPDPPAGPAARSPAGLPWPGVPEGDTIWRVAARLRPALAGQELVAFDAARLSGPRPRPGTTIESVDAVGKHLLVRFADGVLLQTHLRMSGSWHLYRHGERWQRPAHLARVRIDTADWVAVCFAAPLVRTVREPAPVPAREPAGASGPTTASGDAPTAPPPARRAPSPVAHLGPDLTGERPDIEVVLARLAAGDEQRELVDVLLDQTIAAGIGNVYKSELLWLHRLWPRATLASLDEAARRALYGSAHRLLRANLGSGPRVTVPGAPGGVAVYRRRGRACPRCAAPIERAVLGARPRSTYWCPRCQPPPDPAGPRRSVGTPPSAAPESTEDDPA